MNSKNGGKSSIIVAASPNIEQAELVGPNRRRLLKQMAAGAAGVGAFAFMSSAAMAETAADNAVEATAGSNGYGAKLTPGLAPLMLVPGAAAVPAVAHQAGEMYVTTDGSLWYCYTSGNPGSWKQLAGTGASPTLTVLSQPRRIVTTLPTPANPILSPNGSRDFPIAGVAVGSPPAVAVPGGAKAVIGNVTAYKGDASFNPLGGGFLRVFPAGGTGGNTSTLSWVSPQATPANFFMSGLSAGGSVTVLLVQESTGSVHVTLDIVGYFM
jgi:hypothetical protein